MSVSLRGNGPALYDVIRRIRPIHEQSARLVTSSLAGQALSMPVRAVLERLTEDGPQTVPMLARTLYVTRQAAQALVDQAKALDYVEARPNPAHQRSHLIALTEAGSRAFAGIHDRELANLSDIAAGLSADDIGTCVRVLDHLLAGVGDLLAAQQAPGDVRSVPADAASGTAKEVP